MRAVRYVFLPLLAFAMLVAMPTPSRAQISIGLSVHIGPPALPVYVQPVCPSEGYIWTPGYWGYGPDGYFWVPGTWVQPPQVGVLWTPGYWGWGDGAYIWHAGYWGPHVGFYGGINYGFGYGGVGYVGGRWENGGFRYNTAVNNVNVTVIHNTYVDRTAINNTTVNRVSYNGGTGGITARPTAAEQSAEHEQHFQATGDQTRHEQAARGNRAQLASVNHGQPTVAATARPGAFTGAGVVRAKAAGGAGNGGAASYRPPAATGAAGGNSVRGGTPADRPEGNSGRPGNGGAASYRPPAAGGTHENGGAAGGNSVRANSQGERGNGAPAGGTHANPPHASAPKASNKPPSHPNNKPQGGEKKEDNRR